MTHHGWPRVLARICMAHVQEAIAAFTAITDAQRNAGHPRNQRRFQRIRQHVSRVITDIAQVAGQLPAAQHLQLAVREIRGVDVADLGHAFEHGRDPRGRNRVDRDAWMQFHEAREQRLRHQCVTDPVRCDNQRATHQGGFPRSKRSAARISARRSGFNREAATYLARAPCRGPRRGCGLIVMGVPSRCAAISGL
jgi:hypothetical protein